MYLCSGVFNCHQFLLWVSVYVTWQYWGGREIAVPVQCRVMSIRIANTSCIFTRAWWQQLTHRSVSRCLWKFCSCRRIIVVASYHFPWFDWLQFGEILTENLLAVRDWLYRTAKKITTATRAATIDSLLSFFNVARVLNNGPLYAYGRISANPPWYDNPNTLRQRCQHCLTFAHIITPIRAKFFDVIE